MTLTVNPSFSLQLYWSSDSTLADLTPAWFLQIEKMWITNSEIMCSFMRVRNWGEVMLSMSRAAHNCSMSLSRLATTSIGRVPSMTRMQVAILAGSTFASMTAQVSLFKSGNIGNPLCPGFSPTGSGPSDPPPARMEYMITGQVIVNLHFLTHASSMSFMLQTGTGAANVLQSHFFCDSTVEVHGTPIWVGPDSSSGVCKKSEIVYSNFCSIQVWNYIAGGSIFLRRRRGKSRGVHTGSQKRGNGTLRSGHIPGNWKQIKICSNFKVSCCL